MKKITCCMRRVIHVAYKYIAQRIIHQVHEIHVKNVVVIYLEGYIKIRQTYQVFMVLSISYPTSCFLFLSFFLLGKGASGWDVLCKIYMAEKGVVGGQ